MTSRHVAEALHDFAPCRRSTSTMRAFLEEDASCFASQASEPDSTIQRSPDAGRVHVSLRRIGFQAAILVEEARNHIEPPHAGRCFQVQMCAMVGEKFSGLRAPVVQAADYRPRSVARAGWMF